MLVSCCNHSLRTKNLAEVLEGLSSIGKQVNGYGKNVSLSSRLIKSNQILASKDRLEPAFSVDCAALHKMYTSKLRMAQLQMSALKESFDELWVAAGQVTTSFGARDTKTQTTVQTLRCVRACVCFLALVKGGRGRDESC